MIELLLVLYSGCGSVVEQEASSIERQGFNWRLSNSRTHTRFNVYFCVSSAAKTCSSYIFAKGWQISSAATQPTNFGTLSGYVCQVLFASLPVASGLMNVKGLTMRYMFSFEIPSLQSRCHLLFSQSIFSNA